MRRNNKIQIYTSKGYAKDPFSFEAFNAESPIDLATYYRRTTMILYGYAASHSGMHGHAADNIRDAIIGYVRNMINSQFQKYLHFKFDDVEYMLKIRTNREWNESDRIGVIRLYEDGLWCASADLKLGYGVLYSDPRMFDEIDQFVLRIKNG